MTNEQFLQNIFLGILFFASLPILLSWMLRAIAGEHAAAYDEPETEQERADRKAKQSKENEYWRLKNLGVVG